MRADRSLGDHRRSPICRLLNPSAIRAATSRSRWVNEPGERGRASASDARVRAAVGTAGACVALELGDGQWPLRIGAPRPPAGPAPPAKCRRDSSPGQLAPAPEPGAFSHSRPLRSASATAHPQGRACNSASSCSRPTKLVRDASKLWRTDEAVIQARPTECPGGQWRQAITHTPSSVTIARWRDGQQALNELVQHVQVKRLGDVAIRTPAGGRIPVSRARQNHGMRGRSDRVGFENPTQLQPADQRHHHVRDHQIRGLYPGCQSH